MDDVVDIDADNLYTEDDEVLNEDIKKPPVEKLPLETTQVNSSLYPLKNDISADMTCEFLEVAFQQILYHRGIYPKDIFNCCKKYHVGVHICIYPELTQYLVIIIKALKPLISKKKVKQVVLSVLENGEIFEKFVFELLEARNWIQKRDEDLLRELEVSLRECVLRIATFSAQAPQDPTNCSFEILAHVDRSSAMELLYDDQSSIKWVTEDDGDTSNAFRLHPLKTIKDSPFMKMQLYVLGK